MLEGNRECGIRHKFAVRVRDFVPNLYPESAERLAYWCARFAEEGLAPVEGGASSGNLSFRSPGGFVITASRSLLKSGLRWRDFVEVVREDWDAYALDVLGDRVPSSDAFLHARIYAARQDVNAVFHGHDDVVLSHADELGAVMPLVVTEEAMIFGTQRDAIETARALGSADVIVRKGHGFVTVGRTLDQAGERALALHRAAAQARGR